MPAMSWYELKVTGLLGGPKSDHGHFINEFLDLFPAGAPSAPDPSVPPDPKDPEAVINKHEPWPRGFILPKYWAPIWSVSVEELVAGPITAAYGFPKVTHFTFQCQIATIKEGSLFMCRQESLEDVRWFYMYCRCKWFMDLKTHMRTLNETLTAHHSGRVLSALDVRDWKWYCGNGGGD